MGSKERSLINTLLNPETAEALTDEKKLQAVVHKDRAADGTFYYSVKMTGVYCRPSCPTTRPALRKNVAFHDSSEDAAAVAKACRAIEAAEEPPALVAAGSLGSVLVAASGQGVCAISLGDDPDTLVRELQDRFPKAELIGGDEEFERIVAQVIGFIEAPKTSLDLPLDVRGTAFQQRVWEALRRIPAGTKATYAEIARAVGAPKAVRAVAAACAANALAVAIPCHRVVRADGSTGGYRWGTGRKAALLAHERRKA